LIAAYLGGPSPGALALTAPRAAQAHQEYGNRWALIAKLLPGRCAAAAAARAFPPPASPPGPRAQAEPARARRTDNAVKNRWNSTLKRQTQADSDNDSSCPAAKRSKHPCDWRLQPRMARAQSDPSALFLAGMVRAGPAPLPPEPRALARPPGGAAAALTRARGQPGARGLPGRPGRRAGRGGPAGLLRRAALGGHPARPL